MSEYILRNAFDCDMSDYMDDGRTTVSEWYAKNNVDHYGTIHEEIVRCRDCKFYDTDWESEAHPGRWWCDESWHYREPDGFCKWGERRKP